MGVQQIDEKRCNGCRICVHICPEDVYRFDSAAKRPVIKYLRDCQACFLCEIYCPKDAVYVTPFRERRAVRPW